MTRVAIYARFSSDKQNDASTDDQVRLCRDRADAEGWGVVAIFADKAVSGATRDRPELNRLLARAAEFDIVLAESIDRLSRDQEDIAAIHKRLRFAGVAIVTLADGTVGDIHIGLKGTMAAMFLADLGQKTRRGQIGRVAAGRIPGGLSYGYRRRTDQRDARGEVERGLREIDGDQAAIVRRIFAEFAAGDSPRTIALRLNAEKVPSPGGGLWRANAITGNRARRNGILYNDLYAGRIVYNRQRFIRDPETRKRVSRPNPPAEWKRQDVPELRIVDEPLWTKVQARLDGAAGVPAHRQRRPQKLFSGLLVCGACGGSYTSCGNGYWQCSTAHQTGACANNRTIADRELERRVLGAMAEQLLHPDAVRRVVAAYHRRRADNRRRARDGRHALEQRLDQVGAGIARLVTVLAEEDMADVAELQAKLREAKGEREALRAALADMDAEAALPLHPGIEAVFRRQFASLTAALQGTSPKREAARAAIRALIDHIAVQPRHEARGVDLLLHGRLAEMLDIEKGRPERDGLDVDYTAKVVAGARIGRRSTISGLSIARC